MSVLQSDLKNFNQALCNPQVAQRTLDTLLAADADSATVAILATPETNDTLQASRVAKAVWDHGAGLAIGTYLFGPTLPDNAVPTRAWYQVVTTFISATDAGTVALGVDSDDSAGILAAIAISDVSNVLDAGNHEGIQDGTVANFGVQLTAARQFEGLVAVEATTAGKLLLYVEYVVTE